jgi:type 1 glutamine amidotransferase
MGEDHHPIIWSHCVDQGRCFYSAPGHKGRYYEEPEYVEMIEGAIEWAAGSDECLHPIAASESP